jgi:phosphoribosylformylglycinamidine (FGAM) synthase PurS component
MNLPFILNLVIGLIFIYLILSLIASEIQEILTTLLQWRAAHLKKSIEILLTGGEGTPNDKKVKEIVNDLYANPLIKNISQESKEGIEARLRQVSRFVVTLGRQHQHMTLNGNEPSYMPSETFASTLLERLNLSNISRKITVLNLQKMINDEILVKIEGVEGYINEKNLKIRNETRESLKSEFNTFKDQLKAISVDLYNEKTTLLTTINRIRDEFDSFIEKENNRLVSQSQTLSEQNEDTEITKFIAQLKSLKNGIFYQGDSKYNNASYNNTDELIRRLQPQGYFILKSC